MIADHLPALQVVVPLLAAPVCALLRRGPLAWAVALLVSWALLGIAVTLLLQVLADGPISYHLGSWEPPYGIEYRIDLLSGLVLVLITAIAAVVMLYARDSVAAEIPEGQQGWYYTMFLLCLTGLLGITVTGDAFNAFVFLEISSLSSYVLIAMGRDRRSLVAAYQYLIMGTIGATFYIIGVGMLYIMTGTLNMVDLAARLGPATGTPPVLAAMAFLTVGLSLKLALFPLHLWLPNAYAYAPSVSTAFLAATATKVSIYLLMRFAFTVFGIEFTAEFVPIAQVLLVLSVAAMFAGSISAIYQDDVKRMLAYSSVGQIGYITLGISLGSQSGLTGSIVHLFNHGLMKGGLFLLMGGVALRAGTVSLEALAGIGRRMPWTMAGLAICGMSMLGVPGTVGFVSKWYLVLAALERGWWWLVVLIMLSSLLVLLYLGRVIETAYFREPPAGGPAIAEAPPLMLAASWVLVLACVWFGLDTELTAGIAGRAAAALMSGAAP